MTSAIFAAVLALGAAIILLLNWWIQSSARGHMYERADAVPQAEVAIILGAKVYPNGTLSAMLEDRVRSGVDLYRAGRVRKLLMSGDNSERHYDEVTAMRRFAVELGVPSNDVLRDFAGFRTWDSMVRAKKVFGLDRAIVVTQRFHLPRSLFLARQAGLDADGLVADRRQYWAKSMARSEAREVLARVKAWIDVYVLRTRPKFLGPREPLDGDLQRDTPPPGLKQA